MCHWSTAWLSAGPSTMSSLSSFLPLLSMPLPGDRTKPSASLPTLTASSAYSAPVRPVTLEMLKINKLVGSSGTYAWMYRSWFLLLLGSSAHVCVFTHFGAKERIVPLQSLFVLIASSISTLITSFLMLLKRRPQPQLISSCTLFKGTALITVFLSILTQVDIISLSLSLGLYHYLFFSPSTEECI